jgi:hypothetical protein
MEEAEVLHVEHVVLQVDDGKVFTSGKNFKRLGDLLVAERDHADLVKCFAVCIF